MVYVFLADGFEEMEALCPVDIMRRAGLEVRTVGITGKKVTGANGITVEADVLPPIDLKDVELIVLPGGMPGTSNLKASDTVQEAIRYCSEKGIRMAAICAAPSVLGGAGVLEGKRATCFPGFEGELKGAICCTEGVVNDGLITTAKSAGHAMEFALELVRQLVGVQESEAVRFSIMQIK